VSGEFIGVDRAVLLLKAMASHAILAGAPDWFVDAQMKRAMADAGVVQGRYVFDASKLLHCATTMAELVVNENEHAETFRKLDEELRGELELVDTAWVLTKLGGR
jgi:hypothetical protein